jgi:AcrR family transcriptional regulator
VPRLIETETRTGTIVYAVNRILATQGIFGLTLRSIARESRISTGSLLHHFESRERILRVCAHRTGLAMLGEVSSQRVWHGVEGFLPTDDDALLLTRAWLAWVELWRSEEWLESTVSPLRAKELALLAETHEHRLSRPDLDLVAALLEGLRSAICAPSRPMAPARARGILRDASAAALGRSA